MKKLPVRQRGSQAPVLAEYSAILSEVSALLAVARRVSARSVNAVMTATYWEVGRRIVEFEQGGRGRAEYGAGLLARLSADLIRRFGRGFSRDNLEMMRLFYLGYPAAQISETVSRISVACESYTAVPVKSATLSRISALHSLAQRFPLPWSHYVLLIRRSRSAEARAFYEAEALRGGWSVRQLARQIDTQFYERTALSRNKRAMLAKGGKARPEDAMTPEEEIKDPLVLEFLGLKDEYSESELEEALIRDVEKFLLELGNDFTFVGRQRRLRVGDAWYRVDLLLFHRRLRCLVIVDLKLGKFTHADAGQMLLYVNYALEQWTNPGENPPVGLILCTERNNAVIHYTLDCLPNKVLAAEYRTTLPDEKMLAAELARERKVLERRARTGGALHRRR